MVCYVRMLHILITWSQWEIKVALNPNEAAESLHSFAMQALIFFVRYSSLVVYNDVADCKLACVNS